jgi:hypothetical protein
MTAPGRRRPAGAASIDAADRAEGPGVWLVSGVRPAGDRAVARGLAGRLAPAAHVPGDVFGRMIVAGAPPMTRRPAAEAVAHLRLRRRLAAATADGFARAGLAAVAHDVVVGPELPAWVAAATSRPLRVVVLLPGARTASGRESPAAGRGDDVPAAELDRALRRATPRLGLWLDTTARTPAETVEEVLSREAEARVG